MLGRRLMDEKRIVADCEDFVDQLKVNFVILICVYWAAVSAFILP